MSRLVVISVDTNIAVLDKKTKKRQLVAAGRVAEIDFEGAVLIKPEILHATQPNAPEREGALAQLGALRQRMASRDETFGADPEFGRRIREGREYSADERRVCDYLQEITKGQIGCGEDPIGFLIASHAALAEISRTGGHPQASTPVAEQPEERAYVEELREIGVRLPPWLAFNHLIACAEDAMETFDSFDDYDDNRDDFAEVVTTLTKSTKAVLQYAVDHADELMAALNEVED